MSEEKTLDYAGPAAGGRRRRPARPGSGARIVACAVVALAGAVLVAGGAVTHGVVPYGRHSPADIVMGWGSVVTGVGMVGFLIEFVAAWRSSGRD